MVMMIEKMSWRLNQAVEWLLFVLGAGMAAIVAAQVFSRYVLNHSLFWSEELARFLLVWLTFLGAGVAYRRRAHASVDLLYQHLPAAGRRLASLATHVCTLFFAGIMVVYGYKFAYFVRLQISPALFLPKWIPHSIVCIAGVIIAVHALAFFFRDLQKQGGLP